LGISRRRWHPDMDRPLRQVTFGRRSATVLVAGAPADIPVVAIMETTPSAPGEDKTASRSSGAFSDAVCLAVPHAASLPRDILDSFRTFSLPCFSSFFDEYLLESRLTEVCREKINQIAVVQGTLVNVFGRGVLLTGDSGVGKTACSIRLARMGHAWVADDVVVMEKHGDGTLSGHAHPRIAGLIEVRGEGPVPAGAVLDRGAILEESPVDLIVSFAPESPSGVRRYGFREIMGVRLPELRLPVPAAESLLDGCIGASARSLAREWGG